MNKGIEAKGFGDCFSLEEYCHGRKKMQLGTEFSNSEVDPQHMAVTPHPLLSLGFLCALRRGEDFCVTKILWLLQCAFLFYLGPLVHLA